MTACRRKLKNLQKRGGNNFLSGKGGSRNRVKPVGDSKSKLFSVGSGGKKKTQVRVSVKGILAFSTW